MVLRRCQVFINFREGAESAILDAIDLGASYRIVLKWGLDLFVPDQGAIPENFLDAPKDEFREVLESGEGFTLEFRLPINLDTSSDEFFAAAGQVPD